MVLIWRSIENVLSKVVIAKSKLKLGGYSYMSKDNDVEMSDVEPIELVHVMPMKTSWKWKLCKWLTGFVVVVALAVAALIWLGESYIVGKDKALAWWEKTRTEVIARISVEVPMVQIVQASAVDLTTKINTVSGESGVHAALLQAIVDQESSGGDPDQRYHFEPTKYQQRSDRNDDTRRMMASSHGITQVMGYNAGPECGVKYWELYDDWVALRCTAKMLRKLITAAVNKPPEQRLQAVLAGYNGTGPKAELYAQAVMARIAAKQSKELVKVVK